MKKKKALVIGKGKWGRIFISRLKKKVKIIKILRSKDDYKKFNCRNIDWVFVLTNTEKHFQICNYFIKNCKNVFCEKPLTKDIQTSIKLFKNAQKYGCKLYISDIEKFKNKKLSIKKENFIIREKFSHDKKDIFFRYAYHDLYILSDLFKINNFKKFKLLEKSKGKITYSFEINKKLFKFSYSFNSINKTHKLNNTNFLKFKGNPLDKMIEKIILEKENIVSNNKNALASIDAINKIKNKIKDYN